MAGWGWAGITQWWGHAAIAKTAWLPVCLNGARRPERETAQPGRRVQHWQPKARANREGQQMRLNTTFAVGAGSNRSAAALRGDDALSAKRRADGRATTPGCLAGNRAVFYGRSTTENARPARDHATEHPTPALFRMAKFSAPRRSLRGAEKLSTCGHRKWIDLTRYGQRYPSLENPS